MLYQELLKAFYTDNPCQKTKHVASAYEHFQSGTPFVFEAIALNNPGIPNQPTLVPPRDLPRRRLGTPQGIAALWHAIAHIEFNAINLALDACLRFADMPDEYYKDWIQVAHEEAYHFGLVNDHLKTLGHEYGDFPAHNGLWEMCENTKDDCLVRMALVPRVMEARGLDVTPNMMQRLELAGDDKACEILGIILRDELGHVAVGNRWFKYLCEQRGLAPLETFEAFTDEYLMGQLKGPYNRKARLDAGFDKEEMDWLEARFP